jgi:histidyl-tRNA synthetase
MDERKMFPKELTHSGVDFVVAGLDKEALTGAAELAQRLRAQGQSVDLYPEAITKFSELFKYLDQRRARWIVGIRASDVDTGVVTLRDLSRRTNEVISILALLDRVNRQRNMNVHRLNDEF